MDLFVPSSDELLEEDDHDVDVEGNHPMDPDPSQSSMLILDTLDPYQQHSNTTSDYVVSLESEQEGVDTISIDDDDNEPDAEIVRTRDGGDITVDGDANDGDDDDDDDRDGN